MIDRGPIVIYHSKTGFTAKYALWIAEKLECPFISDKEAAVKPLKHYRTLIFGGRLIAGKPQGFDFLRKHIGEFSEQQIVTFVTGSGTDNDPAELKKKIFSGMEDAAERVSCYFLKSGLNYDKMGVGERLVMKTLCRMLKLTGKKELGQHLSQSFDESSPDFVDSLVGEVKTTTI